MHLFLQKPWGKNRLWGPFGIQAQQLAYVCMSLFRQNFWHSIHKLQVSTGAFVVNKSSLASMENQVSRQNY